MSLTLYELPPSPNAVAVRLALGAKGLDYQSKMVQFDDRSQAVDAYGVPLTPGLVHGDTKMYDSHSILRYLDLNFAGPRILPTDLDQLRETEVWERWARNESITAIGKIFGIAAGREEFDQTALDTARVELAESTREFEQTISDREWLVGDSVTVGDLVTVSRLVLALMPESVASKAKAMEFPFWPFFFDHVCVQEERPATRAYIERVMRLDGLFQ